MIKDIIAANENALPNDKELAILRENFPACFHNDGSFDIERFKEYLVDKIAIANEGYELKFLGKNYARLLASLDTTTVIVPDEQHNCKSENIHSKNIYISGDNLDGLKHLLKSYSKNIKCIYIDPPYNTGADEFVYKDNYNFTVEELSDKLSISEEQSKRILDLTKRGSASHSAWLMFMYPRLVLAKDLLDKDGVIFISIDDNELNNLALICNDIFGEDNFVGQLTWEKKKKGSYLANDITNIKEYIIVYAKNRPLFSGLIGEIKREEETYPCVNASNVRDIRIIPSGIKSNYKEKNFTMKKGEIISDTTMDLVLHSDLIIKDGVLAEDLVIEGNWRYGQDSMQEYARNSELYITRDLYLRRRVSEPRYKGLKDLLLRLGDSQSSGYSYNFDFDNLQSGGWGSNEDADEEQRVLFEEQSLMSYPKPVLLIMKLIASMQKDNFIVCDFFSGSATTAEAVLRLNSKNKNIQFIMIQLPEKIDEKIINAVGDDKKNLEKLNTFFDNNNLPHTLDYLGFERIKRAANKIREENPDTTADLGFRHFTLSEPSAETLDKLDKFLPEENSLLIQDNVLQEFGVDTVLTTWLVRDGYGFTTESEKIDFAGYPAYFMEKHLYLVNPELSEQAITAIIEKYETDGTFNPENVVLFGYSFTWTEIEELKTNLARLKETEKNLRINFEIRY